MIEIDVPNNEETVTNKEVIRFRFRRNVKDKIIRNLEKNRQSYMLIKFKPEGEKYSKYVIGWLSTPGLVQERIITYKPESKRYEVTLAIQTFYSNLKSYSDTMRDIYTNLNGDLIITTKEYL